MGGAYGDQFASVSALCQLGIECSPVNLALVEFDIFVGQGDNLVVGHVTYPENESTGLPLTIAGHLGNKKAPAVNRGFCLRQPGIKLPRLTGGHHGYSLGRRLLDCASLRLLGGG